METVRVLNLLNNKASTEFHNGLLEEARDTAMHAVNYYLLTYAISQDDTQLANMSLQCHAQVSALILRKIGDRYLHLGEQRADHCLVEAGIDMVHRSKNVLRLCKTIPVHSSTT
jgi:hypothetical protein